MNISSASPARVLIVNDVMSLEFLMRRNGYEGSIARNGTEALEAIDREPCAVILLDIMMPDVVGYQVDQHIKSRPDRRDAKVIFLSTKSRESDIERGYEAGADLYLTKPFSPRQLMEKARGLAPAPQ